MIDLIRKEISRYLNHLSFFAIGEITKIDFTNYQAQAKILTTGMKTNWLRVGTDYSGDSFGAAKSLNVGDEVLICFPDGNPGAQGIIVSRLFGKDSPPRIMEDETRILHKSGTDILIKKDGELNIVGVKKVNITGNPEITLNGESYAAVLYEKLEAQLNTWVSSVLSLHMHIGNMGAPTPLQGTIQPPQLTPAKSTKVKLGG